MQIATTSFCADLAMTCIFARGAVDDERRAVVGPPYGNITETVVEADDPVRPVKYASRGCVGAGLCPLPRIFHSSKRAHDFPSRALFCDSQYFTLARQMRIHSWS